MGVEMAGMGFVGVGGWNSGRRGVSRTLSVSRRRGMAVSMVSWTKASTRNDNVKDVDGETFKDLMSMASAAQDVIVLKVFAKFCPSCRKMESKYKRLVNTFYTMNFYELDYEENKEFCSKLGVKNLPHFHIYDGRTGETDSVACTWTEAAKLRDLLQKHAP